MADPAGGWEVLPPGAIFLRGTLTPPFKNSWIAPPPAEAFSESLSTGVVKLNNLARILVKF